MRLLAAVAIVALFAAIAALERIARGLDVTPWDYPHATEPDDEPVVGMPTVVAIDPAPYIAWGRELVMGEHWRN
jgi:hypothetical protein